MTGLCDEMISQSERAAKDRRRTYAIQQREPGPEAEPALPQNRADALSLVRQQMTSRTGS